MLFFMALPQNESKGMDIPFIADCTGLSEAEISQL